MHEPPWSGLNSDWRGEPDRAVRDAVEAGDQPGRGG